MSQDHPTPRCQFQYQELGGHGREGSYLAARDSYYLLIYVFMQQTWVSRMCQTLC